MGPIEWIRWLFAPEELRIRKSSLRAPGAHVERAEVVDAEPPPALPKRVEPAGGVGHLDRELDADLRFSEAQEALVARVAAKLETGHFGFPLLPTSAVAALSVANRPSAEIRHLVEVIERDPLLTGEMLRVANSALYSTKLPATTLQQAVMRIGLRSVRSALYSAVMKSDLVNGNALTDYAQETWRESQSAARLARALGAGVGIDAERAYLIGLLHDIGKVALLTVLQNEMHERAEITPELVVRVFREFHERAGRVMAQAWRLPDDVAAIIAVHHDFANNTTDKRGAALAFLAERLDLLLATHDQARFEALAESPAFDTLGVAPEARWELLEHARHLWESAEEVLTMRA